MSLFGLFYTIFEIGCKGVNDVKNVIEDNDHKTRYRNNETNTYLDHNMNKRDLSTNHIMELVDILKILQPVELNKNIKKKGRKHSVVKVIERTLNMVIMNIEKMNSLELDIRILKQENYMLRDL